jgi:hypothetical protein
MRYQDRRHLVAAAPDVEISKPASIHVKILANWGDRKLIRETGHKINKKSPSLFCR